MPAYILRCELLLPVPLEEVFEFFENPYNLARITPPDLALRILTRNLEMRKGAAIEYQFRWLFLTLGWKTLISVYEPPHLFVDEALKSPYSSWRHWHRFRSVKGGTVISDEVHYALPLGWTGRAVHAAFVRPQLLATFRFRQRAVAQTLGVKPVRKIDPFIEMDRSAS